MTVRTLVFCASALFSAAVSAELMNARLLFGEGEGLVQTGRSFCLATEVVQTADDALVIEPYDCTALQPANAAGAIAPDAACLSGVALTEMKELRFDFALAQAGAYETWVRAWFPTANSYNHGETMDGGPRRTCWDSSERKSDGISPVPKRFLQPGHWHWVKNYTYDLSAGRHVFHWPANSAWCGGCKLDRIVLIRKGCAVRPEDVSPARRRVVRAKKGIAVSRPVRLDGLKAWALSYSAAPGAGVAAFERSLDGGATWDAVESDRVYATPPAGGRLLLRVRLETGADGGLPPFVYTHRFRIEKKAARARLPSVPADDPAAEIRVQRIVPNKIIYEIGEKGWADVFLTNRSGRARGTELSVDEIRGLGESRRNIHRGRVDLAPYAGVKVRVPWPGSRARYGHELKASAGGTSRSEYFNVNDDWWRVFQGMDVELERGKATGDTRHLSVYYGFAPDELKGEFQGGYVGNVWKKRLPGWGPFLGYGTTFMRWHVSEASVGGNYHPTTYPPKKRWINSQGTWRRNADINADTAAQHERGVKQLHFSINLMEGPGGFELARRHPEWVARNARGQYQGHYATSDPMKLSDNTKQYIHWSHVSPDFTRDDCFEWAIADLKKGVEAYGEDGVYFDGRYLPRAGFDFEGKPLICPSAKADDAGDPVYRDRVLKSIRRTQEMLVGPDGAKRFIWSSDIPRPESPCTSTFNHPQVGALTEIQWTFLLSPSMPVSNYRGFFDFMLPGRNRCYWPSRYAPNPSRIFSTGFLSPAWMWRPPKARHSWTMCNHVMSLVCAAAAHPFAGGLSMRPYKQMLTRYSEFFWHEDIELPRDGYRHFACDSLREVWFDDAVYRRETPTHVDWYVHLVNTPENEQCDAGEENDPPAVDDAELSTKLFRAAGVKAWSIRPHGYRPDKYEPVRVPVAVEGRDGETVFPIPPFDYYTLVVIRVPKGK